MQDLSEINFHEFVRDKLSDHQLKIIPITESLIKKRFQDFYNFVNSIRLEYSDLYGWKEEDENYFLNPMVDKWKFSYCITDRNDEICFVNFSSVYGDVIHNHCTYVRSDMRNHNLAKFHMIKLCQTGIDHGFMEQEGYWPKNNNRSIILFLKMGWEIDSIRNEKDLKMKADLLLVRNRTYNLLNGTND
ncbi:MAG: hypothetical protein N2510_06270 [Ignavibacteria bacterium]|nr:hypothetical protein [Ignavibacteria bacterium]